MNYIGSKLKLSPWIKKEIINVVGEDLKNKIFCDLFSGTSVIGRLFKSDVKKIISNDIEMYSYVLSKAYISSNMLNENIQDNIHKLNQLEPENGFIYQNYCFGSGSGRLYFSDENGKKIDAIRKKIKSWKDNGCISDFDYYFLLAMLLEAADKVANTASVYGAFLKKLKKTALKPLKIELYKPELITNQNNDVYQMNANDLITEISGDILYLDPPYNARQYGANYHLLNTIAIYDDFIPKGKTGLREYTRSNYCVKSKVIDELDYLIRNANFKYIFLSYNNEGLMSVEQIKDTLGKYGKYSLVKCDYQRFKADKSENRIHKSNSTFEYLHILEK